MTRKKSLATALMSRDNNTIILNSLSVIFNRISKALALYLTLLLTITSTISSVAAQSYGDAELYLKKPLDRFEQALSPENDTQIRLMLVSDPLFQAIAIWDKAGNLVFPDRTKAAHIYDKKNSNNLNRLEKLRQQNGQHVWDSFDFEGTALLYCRNTTLSTCVILDSALLASELSIPVEQLSPVKTNATPTTVLLSIIVLIAGLFTVIFMRRSIRGRATVDETPNHVFIMSGMSVDSQRMQITRDQYSTDIGTRDLKILQHLFENANKVVSKDALYTVAWERNYVPNSRSLDQHIATLRKKLDPTRNRPTIIATVHGQGYRYSSDNSKPL